MKTIKILIFTSLLAALFGCTTINPVGERTGYHSNPADGAGGSAGIGGSAAGCSGPGRRCH